MANFSAKKTNKGKKKEEQIAVEMKNVQAMLQSLMDDMQDALHKDIDSNKKKMPAFKRLKMLGRIEDTLRKINVQEEFLHQNGCQRLADWMKPMPD